MAEQSPVKHVREVLKDMPKNWGRWGKEDEIGSINFLTAAEVVRGSRAVRSGKVFTLGVPVARKEGDPIYPGRGQPVKTMAMDKGFYLNDAGPQFPGGLEYADDVIFMYVQGTTQYDALGHVWYDDKLYNGYDAKTTIAGLKKCSIEPIARHGVVGRGVLLDVARYHGVDHLAANQQITLDDLLGTAKKQKIEIEKHDILVIRTGWMSLFYEKGPDAFFPGKTMAEPGITDEPALIRWIHEMEIPSFSTDTIANEQTVSSVSNVFLPLHGALLRDLGIPFNEICWLEELAADSAKDGQYDFLFVGAPLKIVGGTGSPVNPIAIK
ncbi:MAG: cyclase family protein [Vicinamibacterales bacterium]